MYYNKLPGEEYIYLLLYIDDMLIASKSRFTIDKLKKNLSSEFKMKDLDEVKKVLGMEIERDWKSGKVSLTQKVYLKKILQKFNICKYTIGPHFKLKVTISPTTFKEREYMIHVSYASTINSLMYAMVYTRPDLSQAVSMIGNTCTILVGVIGRQWSEFYGTSMVP